jgi:glycosyltransferase involved in cell wall biosynthesis
MNESWRPVVTVVVPMLNEASAVEECLQGFALQTYPLDLLDVVVVDGGSTDGSRQTVDKWADDVGWVRVVDNPDRRASAAFNRGVEAAKGDVICLFSAHGVPEPTYVEASVRTLAATGAAGVGGRYDHVGTDRVSSAIGQAMVSPFGMASPHRYATSRRDVDTISHPAYRASAMRRVGPFDETLLRNSDYDFNHRMRAAGLRLVVDPEIGSVYRPRGTLSALGRQFWWYGRWKARVVRSHPGSVKLRHLVPPAAVVGVALTPLAIRARWSRTLWKAGAVGYAAMVGAAVAHAARRAPDVDRRTLALSFPVMHGAWGAGFVTSLIEDAARGSK